MTSSESEEQNANIEAACMLAKYAIVKKLGKFNTIETQLHVMTVILHGMITMNQTLSLELSKQTAKAFCDRLNALIIKTQAAESSNLSNRLN
ncbi:MAG: hypothetical protein PHO08_14985 [Methylococcales bacterium]|nr:hypothetical protein [Methylococcales bacterium]